MQRYARLAAVILVCAALISGCGYKLVKPAEHTAIHKGESTIVIKGKESGTLVDVVKQLEELYGEPTATFQGFEEDGKAVVLKVLHYDTGDDYEVVVHVLNGEIKTIFSSLK